MHVARFGEAWGEAGRLAPEFLEGIWQTASQLTPGAAYALLQAQSEVVRVVTRHAMTLAFSDIFRLMAWAFAAALIIVSFCRPVPTGPKSAAIDSH